jgi:hypothetical protein
MAVAENTPAPTAFPLDALPSAAAEYISQLAATGLPVDFLGMAALGALAGAVGGRATLRIDAGWEERAIIWLAIVGDPGSQKSPAIGAVRGPLDAFQADLSKDYADDVALYDELPAKARDKTARPIARRVLVGDTTLEALGRTLADNPAGVLLISDELRALIAGLGQYKNRAAFADRARLLELWAGLPLFISRVKDGHIDIPRPTLSILGGLQPDLLEVLSGPDGLRDRFLISYPEPGEPPRRVGRRVGEQEGLIRARADWEKLIGDLCSWRERERCLTLKPKARDLFDKMHDRLQDFRQNADQAEAVVSWAAKAPQHLARLALVLAVAAREDSEDHLIDVESLQQAWLLIKYFAAMRKALPASEPNLMLAPFKRDIDRAVDALLHALRQAPEHRLTRRQVQRKAVGGARTGREVDALLDRFGEIHPGCVVVEKVGLQETRVVYLPGYEPKPEAV